MKSCLIIFLSILMTLKAWAIDEVYSMNPYKQYAQSINEVVKESQDHAANSPSVVYTQQWKDRNRVIYQGQKIILDTTDEMACDQVRNYLSQNHFNQARKSIALENLCEKDAQSDRYQTITLMWETTEEFLTPIKLNFLTNNEKNIVNDTRNLSYLMVATMGILWALPESVSKWDRNEIKDRGFFSKYKENVRQAPVKDKDDPVINYVGHPVAGAIYYNIARNQGYTKLESFGYSVIMSTFFWEYGFEAVAERPSIQDIIITPIIGSIMGEVFYQWSLKIKENKGQVLGSERLGHVLLFLLNPAGELSDSINSLLGNEVIQEARTDLVVSQRKVLNDPFYSSNYIGVNLTFKF